MSEQYEGITVLDSTLEVLEHKRRGIDPRGLLFCWEPPQRHETYYSAVDPTRGIAGWSRTLRFQQDKKTDNGVVEVLRLGKRGQPDVQVAEYAAPIDPQDLATVATKIGRLYSGTSERGCLCIVETNGVGLTTQEDMLRKYKYNNLYVWKRVGTLEIQRTTSFGWQASVQANLALFLKASRHIERNRVVINSPWLVDEMASAVGDWNSGRVAAKWSTHDDRMRAFFLSIWAAHDWEYAEDDGNMEAQENVKPMNYAATDLTIDEMADSIDEAFASTMMREERA